MDADRTDPEIDAGPTIMYAVQTVDADCDDMFCPACGVAPHVSSTSPLSVHSTGLAMDVDLGEYDSGLSAVLNYVLGEMTGAVSRPYRRSWIPAKFRRIEWIRWGRWRNKGDVRRCCRAATKHHKRLSAMRRQGTGG